MLEFNQEHKIADLSAINAKITKAKNIGKVSLCGISLSAVLLLSGCGSTSEDITKIVEEPVITSTAIIMENGNAMIVDLQSYTRYIQDIGGELYRDIGSDRTWVLNTSSGDKILVDYDSVKFVDGENSHEKAEVMAQALIAESGNITCYDEVLSYGKTK